MLCAYCERKIHISKMCKFCGKICHTRRCLAEHEKECRPKWDKDHITDFVIRELK
jgi:hypothetical protein